MKWELLIDDNGANLARATVPGGWLYKAVEWNQNADGHESVSTSFVPDPDATHGFYTGELRKFYEWARGAFDLDDMGNDCDSVAQAIELIVAEVK